jgi:hypothetical protein
LHNLRTELHQSDSAGADHVALAKAAARQRRLEVPMYDKLDLTKSSSVSVLSAPYKKKGSPLHRRGAGAGARKGVRVTSAPDSRGKPSALLHGYQGYAGGENQVITLSYKVQ